MKRLIFLSAIIFAFISACLPAFSPSLEDAAPLSDSELQGTAAVLSQQTLQAMASQAPIPSETSVPLTPSVTATQPTPTETGIPALLTLTATLLAGTPSGTETLIAGTPPTVSEPSATIVPPTLDGTAKPLFVGTLPPYLPAGTLYLSNQAQADVYISLRCVTKDGYVTILEYPVKKNFQASAPAGNYTYIAWVGGRQFDGGFALENDGLVTITFFKDKINLKKN